ncbi:HNH endonuclease [Pseudoalteromonas sp. R3]|nr:HNH endonuclease [Pseudoalteromonas sp. R3]AZZ98795.1 hypothetical protein ELR70_17825 [Pseudoalteromonas sp. R3]
MDREVWEELGDDPESVRSLSRNIKAGLEILKADKLDSYDHASAIEGGVSYRVHLKRERNSDLRKKFLQKRKREGALSCELCGERATSIDAKYRDSVFEVHHLKPLGLTGETKTSFTDLALLCANCHRAIHSLMRLSPGHISLSQARDMMLLKG